MNAFASFNHVSNELPFNNLQLGMNGSPFPALNNFQSGDRAIFLGNANKFSHIIVYKPHDNAPFNSTANMSTALFGNTDAQDRIEFGNS
jgi:hypothetical protein